MSSSGPTICERCDNVVADTRKQPPHAWLCIRHKRLFPDGFVSPGWWAQNRPFLACKDVNAGACPLFTPVREVTP